MKKSHYLLRIILTDYGTGAVMAVPAHDTRDHGLQRLIIFPLFKNY